MNRRVIGLALVVVTGAALVAAARTVPAEAMRARTVPALPVTAAAEVPVCPGPETLQVPDGAAVVPEPGPVTVTGLVALPSALGAPAGVQASGAGSRSGTGTGSGGLAPGATPGSGTSGAVAPAPPAVLSPLTAGPQNPGAPASGTSASAGTAPGASTGGGTSSGHPGGAPTGTAGPSAAAPTVGAGGTPAPTGPAARVLRQVPTQAGAWRLDVRRGSEVPAVAAQQLTVGITGDLRGLAGIACAPAGTDAWLVGGRTRTGWRARLLLANPGVSAAVVDVTVLGPKGVVPAPAGTGVVVAPGGQKALYVDALAPGLDALAVHVEARSGRVAAVLHDTVLRGTVPGGTEDVGPAAPPARRLVIPGVSVVAPAPGPGSTAGGPTLPTDPSAPGAVAVRVADPDGNEAVVRVHLIGPDGDVNLPGGGVVTVPARGVAEVPVTGVPDGSYAAVVESDTPVVAAALVGRSRTAAGTGAVGAAVPAELAWSPAARPLDGATAAVALPGPSTPGPVASGPGARGAGPGTRGGSPSPAVTARLALASTGSAARVVLAEVGADGSVSVGRRVEVPAGRTATVDLTPGVSGLLLRADDGSAGVAAALLLTAQDAAGELIGVQAVRPGARTAGDAPTVVQDPALGLTPRTGR